MRYDEQELLEELSKDKIRRRDILINLNFYLQLAERITGNIENVRELQEFKIAVVSLENELDNKVKKIEKLIKEIKNVFYNSDNHFEDGCDCLKIEKLIEESDI